MSAFTVGAFLCVSPGVSFAAMHSFGASADSTVAPARSAALGPHSSRLIVGRSPRRHAYLRFGVTGLEGSVVRARLLLYSWASRTRAHVRMLGRGGNWSERSVSARRPPETGRRIASTGDLRRRRWAAVDVTRALNGNGTVNLVLVATGRRALRLSSRESKMEPRLEVLTSDPRRPADEPVAPESPGSELPGGTPPGRSTPPQPLVIPPPPPAPAPPAPPVNPPAPPAPPVNPPAPLPDTQAPTAPASLVASPSPTSLDLAWGSATDNVGVTSYRYNVNDALAGSTALRTARIAGLRCGTTYSVAVVAVDAAGNVSPPRETVAATAPCPSGSASVFVAPGGDDDRPCTSSAPCATFDRAYHAAQPGDVVQVAAGSYPEQQLTADASKTAPAVTFRPAPGASVVVDEIDVEGASYLTFQDLAVGSTIRVTNSDENTLGSHDVSFDSVTAQTFRLSGRIARIAFSGGSFGNTVDNQAQVKKYDFSDPDDASPQAILIDGVRFSDFRESTEGVHTECLQLIHASGLTVRASRFDRCDGTGAIGVTDGPLEHLTFENNFLGKAGDAYFAIQMTKNTSDVVLRNNTMTKGMIFSDNESGGPWLMEGNYMPFHQSLCTAGATHLHNVYAGGRCSGSDLEVDALEVVDADGFDLHLAPGSAAIGRANPASFPASDIDGQSRPLGSAPDAGADEVG